MSGQNCSPAEIAEKKRIAIEKLKLRKAQQSANKTISGSVVVPDSGVVPRTAAVATSHNTIPANNFYKNTKEDFIKNLKINQNRDKNPLVKVNNNVPGPPNSKYPANINNNNNKSPVAPIFRNTITCECYMFTQIRFAVKPSTYSEKLNNVLKTIPSKLYDSNTKAWTFRLADYGLVQERIQALKPDIVIGTLPGNVLKLFSSEPSDVDYSCLASIEPKLLECLLPFQKDGVCFGILKHGRVMIADEMGLGKTYQALAIADFYKDDWPILICTTASTRNSWVKHVRELLPSISCHYVVCLTSGQQLIDNVKVIITSYSLLETHIEKLMSINFGIVILDESHSLKSRDAKRTVVADRLTMKANRVILLSGTPALSRPVELFSQLKMLDRNFFKYNQYTTRYCQGKQTNFGWDASGQSNLSELNAILSRKFMIRRVKSDVLPDLAEKTRETVILDPVHIWNSDSIKSDFKDLGNVWSKSAGMEAKKVLLQLYSKTAEIKSKAVCEYLKRLVKENIKFIIFAHHKVMMDAISSCLGKIKLDFIRIDGTTKHENRAQFIDRFQTKESCQVAVLSLHACNAGITLTAAQLVVFAELDWNPSTLVQAESRAHRIGQKESVTCRYLLAENTADDIIWKMLKEKQNVLQTAGLFCEDLQDGKSSRSSLMTPEKNRIDNFFNLKRKIDENESTAGPSDDGKKSKVESVHQESGCNEFENFLNDDDDDFAGLEF